jgi:hypothetical protein
MDKITFDLQNPIKVQSNIDGINQFIDLDKIFLSAPSFKQKDKTLILKKKFIEAVFAMASNLSKESNEVTEAKLDAKAIKAVLYAAKDFDIVSYFNQFSSLLLNVAFKDEDLTQPLLNIEINKISENDFEELLAKYIEIFFIVSWMKTLN